MKKYTIVRSVHQTGSFLKEEWDFLSAFVDSPGQPFFMGHRLGDYRHYPMHFRKEKEIRRYKSVVQLMREAFLYFGLTGVEFDIRLFLRGDETIYITHDPLGYPEEAGSLAREYLQAATLELLLDTYIKEKFYEMGPLGIELKSQPIFRGERGYFSHDMQYMGRMISALKSLLDRMVGRSRLAKKIRPRLLFASFDLLTLERLAEALGPEYSCYLILTAEDKLLGGLGKMVYHNDPLWQKQKDRIARADFLRGVWFDPAFMARPAQTLGLFSARRQRPLEIYLSTYYSGRDLLRERLSRGPRFPIHGLFFELD
ncbi:MAG: hypothetical protein HS115_03895 [Spirochaetales bacterium]|nr:hypothetical protein [Spirochaetales bacterium]